MKESAPYRTATLSPDDAAQGTRILAAEVPVAVSYNGVAHVVMMASPSHLDDFAVGFSISEQIVDRANEIGSIETRETDKGLLLSIEIPKDRHARVLDGRRNLVGQTGCGICGVVELDHVMRNLPPITGRTEATSKTIFSALAQLPRHQTLNRDTGAAHAAALVGPDGTIRLVREDVGRHNALDKLIGTTLRSATGYKDGFVLVTSRCSQEMVQKTIVLGAPLLVAISVPTTLAVEVAKSAGLALIALARPDSMLCFNDPNRQFTDLNPPA